MRIRFCNAYYLHRRSDEKSQRFVSATNTALVLSLEPVFAAMFGAIVLGETLTAKAMFGACLILVGMIVAEVRLPIFSSASRRASYTG